MPASWAAASHGKAVPHQRTSPRASRSKNRSNSGRVAAERIAWRLGSIPLAKRLLRCAQMLRARVGASTSISSSRVTVRSCASLASARKAAWARSSRVRTIGCAPSSVTLRTISTISGWATGGPSTRTVSPSPTWSE